MNINKVLDLFGQRKVQIMLVIAIPIIWLTVMGIYFLSKDGPPAPQLFPIDDAQGQYFIFAEERSGSGRLYWVKYTGTKAYFGEPSVSIFVGKSDINLDQLLNKPIRIAGDFVYSQQQCIVDNCVDIPEMNVFNIKAAEVVK